MSKNAWISHGIGEHELVVIGTVILSHLSIFSPKKGRIYLLALLPQIDIFIIFTRFGIATLLPNRLRPLTLCKQNVPPPPRRQRPNEQRGDFPMIPNASLSPSMRVLGLCVLE